MEFQTFVRKPFVVEAIEVTVENINDISEFVGTMRTKDDGTPYIQVDRRLIPNVFRVYPGFWMTKMGDNIRCYSERIFNEQFIAIEPETQSWVDFLNKEEDESVREVIKIPGDAQFAVDEEEILYVKLEAIAESIAEIVSD